MTFPKEDILTILEQNIAIRKSAFPLSWKRLTAWAKGLGLRRGGKVVIFTGHMYQIIPFIKGVQKRQKKISSPSQKTRLARIINPIFSVSTLMSIAAASPQDIRLYNGYLRNIVFLLRLAGIDPGYLYEREDYAGTLAYDMGLQHVFERHTKKVYRTLKEAGVGTVITVDPHTTYILGHIYPELINGFDLEVKSYLEILAEKLPKKLHFNGDSKVVIHDSCVYTRYLDESEIPRKLLKQAGYNVCEPELSGRLTHCCGGPIEALFPGKAREIAQKRLESLSTIGKKIVTMCPVCHLNLKAVTQDKVEIKDISEYLLESSSTQKTST